MWKEAASPNGSGSAKLYEGGPQQALQRILDIAIQMAWALHYAHQQGLVHQDVKPANVMMTPDGTAKVTDFGLARARAAASEASTTPDGGSMLVSWGGRTPAYASLEQMAGKKLSRRTDIWSWAVSVLEMFAGEVTWGAGPAAGEVKPHHRLLIAEHLEHIGYLNEAIGRVSTPLVNGGLYSRPPTRSTTSACQLGRGASSRSLKSSSAAWGSA